MLVALLALISGLAFVSMVRFNLAISRLNRRLMIEEMELRGVEPGAVRPGGGL